MHSQTPSQSLVDRRGPDQARRQKFLRCTGSTLVRQPRAIAAAFLSLCMGHAATAADLNQVFNKQTVAANATSRVSSNGITIAASAACRSTLREASVALVPETAPSSTPIASNAAVSPLAIQDVQLQVIYGHSGNVDGVVFIPLAATYSNSSKLPYGEYVAAALIGTHTFSPSDATGASEVSVQAEVIVKNSSASAAPVGVQLTTLSSCAPMVAPITPVGPQSPVENPVH